MRVFILHLAALASALPAVAQAAEAAGALPYVASRANRDQSLECLTQAIYYEARSESADGQRAVAQVVLNRARHPSYPNSVCGVVFQGSERRTGCQFTFTCDGSMNGAVERGAWDRAERIAASALSGSVYRPVGLALNYHTTAIRPYWAPSLVREAVIGAHIFYSRPNSTLDTFSQAQAVTEADVYLPPIRFASRPAGRGLQRSVRLADLEIPVEEIPVLERPVRFRTIGARVTQASAPIRPAPRRAAAIFRSGPRLAIESGVRVARGS